MKSNSRFKQKKESVSSVIEVIILVVITVPIAAFILIYTSTTDNQTKTKPVIIFTPDFKNRKLTITTATQNILWSDVIVIITDGADTSYYEKTGYVTAGDEIFIDNYSDSLEGEVTVTILHIKSNSLFGTWTFS